MNASAVARSRAAWFAAVVLLAGTLLVAVLTGTLPYTALGNGDPGVVVRVGTPLLRVLADLSAALCTGSLAYAALVSTRRQDGGLTGHGYAAVQRAGRWSLLWLVTAGALVPFSIADGAGQGLSASMDQAFGGGNPLRLLAAMETPMAWLLTALLAAVIAIATRFVLRLLPAMALLLLGVVAILPPLAAGHAASQAGHDIATSALVVHVPVALVWGGLLATLLRPARRAAIEPRRYRRIALTAWLTLVASGLFDAAMFVTPAQLVSTQYGLVLLAKVVLVLVLGAVGMLVRRRTLAPLVELVLLAAAGAASAGLSHIAPPSFTGEPNTAQETLLGYHLAGAPTPLRLLTDWRFEPLLGSLAVVLALTYVVAVLRLRRRGGSWPGWRTATWLLGCLVLLLATSSGLGRYEAAMFSMHLASHMLLSMLAPLLLALGGPLTLLHAVRPRRTVDALTDSSAVRLLTHPLPALVLFAGAPFLLYFTELFDAAARFHWAHLAINVVFLLIGYLFAWPVVGVDPTPRPLPTIGRLGMLLAAMPADIVFGALVIKTGLVIGNGPAGGNMYSALALPWVRDLAADQRLAGELALLIGEVSLLVAIVALLLRWKQIDRETDEQANVALPAPARSPQRA